MLLVVSSFLKPIELAWLQLSPHSSISLPIAIFWGIVIFDDWPDKVTIFGIALILGSGLYIIWRETTVKESKPSAVPRTEDNYLWPHLC